MNVRKLGTLLVVAGLGVVALSVVWFLAAYGEALGSSVQGGQEVVGMIAACLYSSSAVCQGALFFSNSLPYTPIVFWIGALALLAGVIVWVSSKRQAPGAAPHAATGQAGPGQAGAGQGDTPLPGLLSKEKLTRTVYILMLVGAAGCILLPPLAVIGLLGLVLALWGAFGARPQLEALDRNHLLAVCVIFAASSALLILARGSLLFLAIGLAQLALYYIGFNSFRRGRTIGIGSIKDEALLALKPEREQRRDPD